MGYSDTSTLLTYCNQLGLVTFHGPCIMSGFSQMEALGDAFKQHIHDILFETSSRHEYAPYSVYHEGYPDWNEAQNAGKVNE